VNLSNLAEYLEAGAFALGVGAELVNLAALHKSEPDKNIEAAKAVVNAVRLAREKVF
jgi:2-keto-3-deoxy-6-phosphogluconate aldolase